MAIASGTWDNGDLGSGNWEISDSGALTVSGTGEMETFSSYDLFPWYSYSTSVTSIIIESGITSISKLAFYESVATSVSLPNTLITIGESAFARCIKISSINIPNSVQTIGPSAFISSGTGSPSILTSITIGENVTSIGDSAFKWQRNVETITFKSEVAPTLGYYSFQLGDGTKTNNAIVYTNGGWGSDDVFTQSVRGGSSDAKYTTFIYAQWTAPGTYVFSAKYDRISADQILDNIGKTITIVQNKLHEYITSLGGVTYTESSGVFSYSLPAVTETKATTVTLPGAEVVSANNKEHASSGNTWKVTYTLPAESYASYHSMNNIVTSLNALKTHYNSMKHAKVTQVSMSAMFMALASLLSSLTYHRARFVDRTILRSNVQTTAVAGGSVTPTVSVANITNWGNNISAIAHATAEQSSEVFNISGNGTAALTSSSCSSSSSSSCSSSSCSSSSCSSSCSCFFVVFYNLGGL